MTREENIFDLNLSYYLERSFARVTGRLDLAITVIILLSSCSAFTWLASTRFVAVIIATLTVIQLVYQFGKKSGGAQEQARRYQQLILNASRLSADELHQQRLEIEKNDSDAWSVLQPAAYKRAALVLGLDDQTKPLTKLEWIFSFIGGNLPKR